MLKCAVVGRGVVNSKTPEILLKNHGITSCTVYDYSELFANVAEQMKKDHDILFITSPFKDLFGGNICIRGVVSQVDVTAFERVFWDYLQHASPYQTLIVGNGYLGKKLNEQLFMGRAEVIGRNDSPKVSNYYLVINTVPKSERVFKDLEADVAIDLNYTDSPFLQDFLSKGTACQNGLSMLKEVIRVATLAEKLDRC